MTVEIVDPDQKERIAEQVLLQLPEWFGVPESTRGYIEGVRTIPFWAAMIEGKAVGFIALRETSPATAEIYVMGVVPARHRHGTGHALYKQFELYAKTHGYSFVQVKTVRKGSYESYDKTNAFYTAMGFQEFECFPDYWDEANPCQIYVKAI